MDESFAPGGPIDKTRLKALSARSDAKGLVQFASHLAALPATGAAIVLAKGTPWLALALPLHGIVLVFLFAPLHESIHRTAFRTRRLNDIVAWLCGVLLVLPPAYFRTFHFAHHRHTQDPAR
ncbi:MAG: fatty acid desaturase, partial [Rhodospirillales bacterium]|nr:fatty acid desaturase [Rhodospirillales bacterium]